VSEFERSRSVVPPFAPSARPDALVSDEELDAPAFGESTYAREGLPAGFRMRHDAHYVDQLTSRATGPQVRLIPIGDIDLVRPGDARDLAALVNSIQKHGVLQPLLVRPRAGRFELIAGARRLAAAAQAALSEVPCLVHQVDEVRARALADADNVHAKAEVAAPVVPAAPSARPVPVVPTFSGLQELSQSLGTIGSCLHLLGQRETSLRDRVALDLVRTETLRASRLVHGLRLLAEDPTLAETGVSLVSAFDQVAESFLPERRLSGASLTIEPVQAPHRVRADPDWLSVGLAGALGGMLALAQSARGASLTARISGSASGTSVVLEIDLQGVSLPTWAAGRFFDPEWTDRPGGFQAAIELAAARRVAELHRGGIEMVPGERSGCRLVFVLPAA
jgi:hypothetical protein